MGANVKQLSKYTVFNIVNLSSFFFLMKRPLGCFVRLQATHCSQPPLSVTFPSVSKLATTSDGRYVQRPRSLWVRSRTGRIEDENGRGQQWWDSAERGPCVRERTRSLEDKASARAHAAAKEARKKHTQVAVDPVTY